MSRNGVIRKTYGPLSSGTRCEILTKPLAGFIQVKVGPFSKAFYEQNEPLAKHLKLHDGVFEIETELVEEIYDGA